MKRRYFGTDGIRGHVGEGAINPEFMLKLGWAVGRVLAKPEDGQKNLILIGKDTRISGYMFESALQAGLIAAGVDVGLLGPMPTPAIAYLTRTFHARAGIVISASHNPYHDNGIKFFSGQGSKLADEVELAIEDSLGQAFEMCQAAQLGKATRIEDAAGRYIEYCKSTVPMSFNLRGLKIVIDCANGATYHIAPNVFRELGAEVVEMSTSPDGFNINRGCGSTEPEGLQERVVAESADLGLAFDGDGDRLICVDELGEIVDGDELLFIIASHRLRTRGRCEGVVGTLMSNLGMELALTELGIGFSRANVGDRYVVAEMRAKGWQLGGESSGHLVCADVSSTGDGVVSALQVLEALVTSERCLSELKAGMTKFPQTMINVRMDRRVNLDGHQPVQAAVQAIESELGSKGRVLLRLSGTEPVVRVMVEGENALQVDTLAGRLADDVRALL